MLDTGRKLSDDNTIGQDEIQQRLAQFVEHWKDLKDLAAARSDRASFLFHFTITVAFPLMFFFK